MGANVKSVLLWIVQWQYLKNLHVTNRTKLRYMLQILRVMPVYNNFYYFV